MELLELPKVMPMTTRSAGSGPGFAPLLSDIRTTEARSELRRDEEICQPAGREVFGSSRNGSSSTWWWLAGGSWVSGGALRAKKFRAAGSVSASRQRLGGERATHTPGRGESCPAIRSLFGTHAPSRD